jgi:oligoribonuclease
MKTKNTDKNMDKNMDKGTGSLDSILNINKELDRAKFLVWMDLEMTGLDPKKDRILEIAVFVTDQHLNILSPGLEMAIHQSELVLENMNDWCKKTHGESGLVTRVKESSWTEKAAEQEIIKFLKEFVSPKTVPLCGNSIWQDRRFLCEYMPDLDNFLHYRCVDVSTLKELARRWKPELIENFKKKSTHTALSDIEESIGELKFYRDQGFVG